MQSFDHYWFDTEVGSFWPVEIPADQEPGAACYHKAVSAEASGVMLGGMDGYVRQYRPEYESDDGTEIASRVVYGPIGFDSADYREGMVAELTAALADGSGPVDWSVAVGDTHQQAASAAAFDSGTWTENQNLKTRPRARGMAFILKLENGATHRRWAIERAGAVVKPCGRERPG